MIDPFRVAPHWSIAPVSTGGTTEEPVSIATVRSALRVEDNANEYDLLQRCVRTGRTLIENEYRTVIMRRQFDYWLDAAPCERYVKPPYWPLVSVESIVSFDPDGAQTSMSSSDYIVDTATMPGRVCLANGASWPTSLRDYQAIRIRMTLGHSASSTGVPDPMVDAVLQVTAFLYEHRGEAAGAFAMPPQVAELMAAYYLPDVV